jgi:ferredoxin
MSARMANRADKYADNVPGTFYVDDQCIDCDACRTVAPLCFARNDEGGFSFVCRQPASDEEARKCQEALEGCPVEAIGNDGLEA